MKTPKLPHQRAYDCAAFLAYFAIPAYSSRNRGEPTRAQVARVRRFHSALSAGAWHQNGTTPEKARNA